jgi:hypothetical protein
MSYWSKIRPEINALCNAQFDTPEYRRFFAVPSTQARLELRKTQFRYYARNRRDIWALAQSKVPLDVKRAIWEHEKGELMFDERLGRGHITEQDFAEIGETKLLPGVRSAFYAFLYLGWERPWLEALMAPHIQERKNNGMIVRGGGIVQRMARKELVDLGGNEESLDTDTRVHMVADVEHTDMFEAIFEKHITDEASARRVVQAAEDSLAIFRLFIEAITTAQLELEGPSLPADWRTRGPVYAG